MSESLEAAAQAREDALDKLLDQPAPDTAWADKYGSVLKPIALKYGEQLFNFTMSIGVANVATQTIMRRIRGNNELTKSMMILVSTLDAQAKSILAMSNSMEQFLACKTEIESSTPAIMIPEAAGRIVVPS